jgi:hypothetical protein
MSSAFVREGDDQWLHEIAPSIEALINYLSRENGGLSISLKKIEVNAENEQVHAMSDGFNYVVRNNVWVCLD